MEVRNRLDKLRCIEISKLILEVTERRAESFELLGIFNLLKSNGVLNEEVEAEIIALAVLVVKLAVSGGNYGKGASVYVGIALVLLSDVLGYVLDIVHKSVNVAEDRVVYSLKYVSGFLAAVRDRKQECAVYVSESVGRSFGELACEREFFLNYVKIHYDQSSFG